MTVEKVISAQAARFVSYNRVNAYLPDVVRAVHQQYGFVKGPETARELLPPDPASQAIVFEHGKLELDGRSIIIQRFEIYSQSLVVHTETSTEDSAAVLENLIEIGRAHKWILGVSGPRQLYLSTLEFRLTTPLDEAFPPARQLADSLVRAMASYGFPKLATPRLIGLAVQPDPLVEPLHADIRIERRANVSYEDNLYFSQAPLRTAHHVAALEEFDRALASFVKARAT
jgi:hypothetical protein